MLRHAGVVVVVVYDEQMSFQVTGKVFQICLLVAFRVRLRSVHIALTVHYLVVSPVDNRSAGNAYLENFGIAQHQRRSHVSSEAPAVHADTLSVHIRLAFQEFYALHLVFALFDAQLAEGGVFKLQSTVAAATVVEAENDVAFVCHVDVPAAGIVHPAVRYHLGVRAAVYVDDGGILLCRVEVDRLYQAVVQVCLAVGGFDGAYFYAGHFKAFVGVLGCQQCVFPLFLRVGGHQFYDTGASGRRGIVDEVSSHETGDLCRVHAGWVSYQVAFAILQVDSVKVTLQRRDFRTLDDELFRVPVKTYDVLYKPGAGGELLQQFPFRIV